MNRIPVLRPLDAAVFAWTVWALMTALSGGLVVRYGSSVPVWDDYDILGRTLGDEPVTLRWLWSQHNEHRVPLPRLVLLGLDRTYGPDARAGMYFSVAALAIAAALLLWATARWRGVAAYPDAIVPLVLLGPGHHANLLWSWQVQFTLSTALFIAFVATVVGASGGRIGGGRTAALGVLLAAGPLCGANGVAFVPFLAGWMGFEALRSWRASRDRRAAWLGLAAVPGLGLTLLYFRDFHGAAQHPVAPGFDAWWRTLLQFLALGAGPVGERAWSPVGIAIGAGLVAASAVLSWSWFVNPEQRTRAGGLLAAILAFAGLAVALAWGRSGLNDRAGLEPRYVTLASPALCLLYLSGQLIGLAGLQRFLSMSLLVTVSVFSWPNAQAGRTEAVGRARRFQELTMSVRRLSPPSLIARRFTPFLHPSQDVLSEWLPIFRTHRIAPFERLAAEGPLDPLALPIEPIQLHQITRDGTTFTLSGTNPFLTFALPRTLRVVGLRIDYDLENGEAAPAHFRVAWRSYSQPIFGDDRQVTNWALPVGRQLSTTAWIHDPVDEMQIRPDTRPGTFRIRGLTLLVPPLEARGDGSPPASSPVPPPT